MSLNTSFQNKNLMNVAAPVFHISSNDTSLFGITMLCVNRGRLTMADLSHQSKTGIRLCGKSSEKR